MIKEKINWIDNLKVLGILAVVLGKILENGIFKYV